MNDPHSTGEVATGEIQVPDMSRDLLAIETATGAALRREIRTLRLTGPDRVRFLNGMVSNDVAALSQGRGSWAVKTNNKGRIEALMRVRAAPDAFFLDVRDVVATSLLETLERFIIMDDCTILDVSADRTVISVLGPGSKGVLEASGIGPVPDDLAFDQFVRRGGVEIVRDRSLGVPGYELHVAAATAVSQLDTLLARGAVAVAPEALEVVRIEAGIPIDGRDLDAETLPMEARLEYAISSTKGCYVGQEVIARGTLQGQVNYHLVGLRFTGSPSAEGAELKDGERHAGEVSSVVFSPRLAAWIGLGYVRRNLETPGTKLLTAGPKGDAAAHEATVVALPFLDRAASR
jgi:folate-binding protein YgfZ